MSTITRILVGAAVGAAATAVLTGAFVLWALGLYHATLLAGSPMGAAAVGVFYTGATAGAVIGAMHDEEDRP